MTTNNIVSTPNITGNIGSCSTTIATAIIKRDSLFQMTQRDYATNSCTGEVTQSEYQSFTGSSFVISILVFFVICFTLGSWASKY